MDAAEINDSIQFSLLGGDSLRGAFKLSQEYGVFFALVERYFAQRRNRRRFCAFSIHNEKLRHLQEIVPNLDLRVAGRVESKSNARAWAAGLSESLQHSYREAIDLPRNLFHRARSNPRR